MTFKTTIPKDDNEYFSRMSRAIFQAGLNWKMVDNKWPAFKKAFADFDLEKVAAFDEKKVKALMENAGIVRNEKKIRATILNAQEMLRLQKKYGSFKKYLDSFNGDEVGMMFYIEEQFSHLGPSSSRIFMWMSGVKLTPTLQERDWIEHHNKKSK